MPRAVERYGSGAPLVFDTSAWNRQRHPSVAPRWRATLAAGLFVICPVVTLELLAAASDEDAFRGLDRALNAMPQAPITRAAGERAISATRELAGERRLPATDYLIAAAAAERGFGVLHYDRHFDPLCRVFGVESVLVAPRGSLD